MMGYKTSCLYYYNESNRLQQNGLDISYKKFFQKKTAILFEKYLNLYLFKSIIRDANKKLIIKFISCPE